jgi:hypothetical protein
MIRITKESTHSTDEVMGSAADFFGPKGLGLEEKAHGACCVDFEGGGGYVSVTVVEGENKRDVEVESKEWDYQVKRFLETI